MQTTETKSKHTAGPWAVRQQQRPQRKHGLSPWSAGRPAGNDEAVAQVFCCLAPSLGGMSWPILTALKGWQTPA